MGPIGNKGGARGLKLTPKQKKKKKPGPNPPYKGGFFWKKKGGGPPFSQLNQKKILI